MLPKLRKHFVSNLSIVYYVNLIITSYILFFDNEVEAFVLLIKFSSKF